jgi:hypothetical protein
VIDARFDAKFWAIWGDGKAEVNSYDLTFPRYNQQRKGLAIAIFVTEPFSDSARVKADAGKHSASDVFPVMKLNLVKKYQTGVYDYSDMTSAFVALAPFAGQPAGTPAKISFSSQEWCGHVYSQFLIDRNVRFTQHSYFDGEADQQRNLAFQKDGLPEDALMLWARGVARPWETTLTAPVLTSLETVRGKHLPVEWQKAEFSRDETPHDVRVPAGRFKADVLRMKRSDGSWRAFYIERASPGRIVKWETSDGEIAELRGTDRMKYWELNKEGGEAALSNLGLTRVAPLPRQLSR